MLCAAALISVQDYAPGASVAPALGASRSAAHLVRMSAAEGNPMSFAEDIGIPCEGDCEAVYSKLPASVKPGVVTGQALVDLLDYAKARRPDHRTRHLRLLAARASLACHTAYLPHSPRAGGGLRYPCGQLHLLLLDQRLPRGCAQERRTDHDPGAFTAPRAHARRMQCSPAAPPLQQHTGQGCVVLWHVQCGRAVPTCAGSPCSSRRAALSSTPVSSAGKRLAPCATRSPRSLARPSSLSLAPLAAEPRTHSLAPTR